MPELARLRQVLACLTLTLSAATCSPGRPDAFQRRELTIPMRDGTTLFAVALIPARIHDSLPILLIRTPFGAEREFPSAVLPAAYRELAEDGYIFVTEDIRGRFRSGGGFVTLRPQAAPGDSGAVDESTDAWDTIDWLVRHLPHNSGKVGVLGVSYRGWLAALAGIHPHPALRAISPQAPVGDAWLGDDFFHQGAFRQTQAVAYAAYIEGQGDLNIPDSDEYTFYLKQPTLSALARSTGIDTLPTWVASRSHPTWDAWWQQRSLPRVLTRVEVPTLFVGGWWDQEDILGAQLTYGAVEQADTQGIARIVLGPWFHGGWALAGGDSLGPIRLGSNTADFFRAEIQRPWFAYYLHGKGDGRFPAAWAFETGANQWRQFDRWPPRGARPRRLYLQAGGRLSFEPPADTAERAASDSFVSDPANPVPYTPGPDDGSGWRTWLEQDQRFLRGRADVLSWESEPLAEDLTIAGEVRAYLFASTSGTDADWVVKLIDLYPDTVPDRPMMGGYQLMVNADILRGRYWKGFTVATPIPSGTVTPFTIDLHQQLYRFRKGHRLMVQVQSSWFPLYDRNPQQFVPSIFEAVPGDYQAATHRVWHSPRYPSQLELPVLAAP